MLELCRKRWVGELEFIGLWWSKTPPPLASIIINIILFNTMTTLIGLIANLFIVDELRTPFGTMAKLGCADSPENRFRKNIFMKSDPIIFIRQSLNDFELLQDWGEKHQNHNCILPHQRFTAVHIFDFWPNYFAPKEEWLSKYLDDYGYCVFCSLQKSHKQGVWSLISATSSLLSSSSSIWSLTVCSVGSPR